MIKEAAIIKDGIVYTGRRHHEIIQSQPFGFFRGCAACHQGFVTDEGKYVCRHEAARIAFECGQIKIEKKILFSEDLY